MRRLLYSREETIVGLDLSLQAAAACAIPRKWSQDMSRVRTIVAGYELPKDAPEEAQAERREDIAHKLVSFAEANIATAIFVEEYAFSQGSSRAHALGELGGVVKHELRRRLKLTPQTVTASRARKVLLQWLPRKDSKIYTHYNVKRLKGPTLNWTGDEIDSFVVANYGLMVIGGLAMTFEGEG